jgi:hypothetical protein
VTRVSGRRFPGAATPGLEEVTAVPKPGGCVPRDLNAPLELFLLRQRPNGVHKKTDAAVSIHLTAASSSHDDISAVVRGMLSTAARGFLDR